LGESDHQVLEFGFRALDSAFLTLKNKIRAEENLKSGNFLLSSTVFAVVGKID